MSSKTIKFDNVQDAVEHIKTTSAARLAEKRAATEKRILDKFEIDYINGEATLFDEDWNTLDKIDLWDLLVNYENDVKTRLIQYYKTYGHKITVPLDTDD